MLKDLQLFWFIYHYKQHKEIECHFAKVAQTIHRNERVVSSTSQNCYVHKIIAYNWVPISNQNLTQVVWERSQKVSNMEAHAFVFPISPSLIAVSFSSFFRQK